MRYKMRKFIFIFLFASSFLQANTTDATATINSVQVASSFNDFATAKFTTSIHITSAWNIAYADYDCEFYDGTQWVRSEYRKFWKPQLPVYDGSYNNDVFFEGISHTGNGSYRFLVEAIADPAYDSKGYYYFTVTDVVAPLLPASFAGSWDNGNSETGHPKLTWAANTEMDLKEYEVWKKVDDWYGNNIEPWAKKASTTNTSYVDNSEIGWEVQGPPRVVYYKIRAVDQSNNASAYTTTQRFDCNNGPGGNSAKGELVAEPTLPRAYQVNANYPNPFNPVTTIGYALPEESRVVLDVYSLSGQKVAGLQNGVQQAGNHTLRFDGSNLSSGIYLYRFSAVGQKSGKRFNAIKRMLLIK